MSVPAKPAKAITVSLQRPYGRLALAAILFAACGAFLWHQASTNDRGLIINGLIHLEPDSADVFYAVLAALMLGFTGVGLASIYGLSRLKEFRVLIGKTTLKMPPARYYGLAGEVSIPLAEILRVETHPANAPKMLVVCTEEGRFYLSQQILPEGWTIPELAGAIIARAREASARA